MIVASTPNPLHTRPLAARLTRLCIPLAAVLALGTLGFMWTEGWGAEQSLYFTIITFTTVGYGDYDLTIAGHRVAIAVILFGFGVFTYVLGQLMEIVVERQLDWERTMQRRASELTDHYIIVGFGRIGHTVCERLARERIPFVLIDANRDLVEQAVREGHTAITADATHDTVLRDCGIERARGLACLTSSDAKNIVITLSARALCPDLHIISRAESDDHARKLHTAGASRVISPTRSGATSVANSIIRPHTIDLLDHAASAAPSIEFCRITVRPDSPLVGRPLAAATGPGDTPLMVVAIERADGSTTINPPRTHTLNPGETLIVAGHPGAVVSFVAEAA